MLFEEKAGFFGGLGMQATTTLSFRAERGTLPFFIPKL
jgi:hypothetical protein